MTTRLNIKLRVALAAGTMGALLAAPAATAQGEAAPGELAYETTEVVFHPAQEQLGNVGVAEDARASITRRADGVSVQLHTNSLIPGDVYTMWFAAVDNPQACSARPCPPPEVAGNADVDGQVTWTAGLVAGDTAGTFAAEVPTGPLAGWAPARSFDNPMGAEIHLVIHNHGPLIPERTSDMLNSYRDGCTDESLPPVPETGLADGEPGPNECRYLHVAVFSGET